MIPSTLNNVYLFSVEWFFTFVEKLYYFIMSFRNQKFTVNVPRENTLKIKLIHKKPFSAVRLIKRKKTEIKE
jgi:hypothetical protein